MDFEKFIEKDIIEFLDEQTMMAAEKAAELREEEFDLYEITEDYSREITKALKEGNLRKAQEIFEDVKNKFTKAPENALSKRRFYIIMEEIYEKIKDYEANEEGKKSLFETIREYEEKGLFAKPDVTQKKDTGSISLLLSTINIKEKELERLTSKKPITNYDFAKAIQKYRQLKELIKRIPIKYEKEKAKAYESALTWFYTIRRLKERTEKAELAKAGMEEVKKKRPIEQVLAEVRKTKEGVVNSHLRITEFIRRRDLTNSISEYRKLKKLCESFPDEMEEEKTALLADALSLYESIKRLKQNLEKERGTQVETIEREEQEQRVAVAAKDEIRSKLYMLKQFLAERNSSGAAKEYEEIRDLFKNYNEGSLEEKKQLFDEIIGAHKDIRLLDEDMKRKSPSYDQDNVAEIRKQLEEIQELLEKNMVEQATHQLLEAKHRIEMLPKEAFDDKYYLTKEAEAAEHKILFIINMRRINTPSV
ncbi:MAG TPA: hypothetical protein VJ461_06725 [Candidatus Nanoarchaeia archaeon]|nr:hypothetical protein [Candidatus Nanoarchaeia archaeon]